VLGSRGEEIASAHICRLGYVILQRNYRSRSGEIDIIARDGETLVFAEVKTRRSDRFGSPEAAVTYRKQGQISRVAQEYLARENLFDTSARFDVVAVFIPDNGQVQIQVIKNAFELQHTS
jgi:putative endonuclease